MNDIPLLSHLYSPGDRVSVVRGQHAGKQGTVTEVCGDRVAVRSDAYPDGQPKLFQPGYLVKIGTNDLKAGNGRVGDRDAWLDELGGLCSPSGEAVLLDAGEHSPPSTGGEVLGEDRPLDDGSNSAKGTTVPQPDIESQGIGSSLGNSCSPSADIALLEHLIYKHRQLCQKDTLCDRWLHEEASDSRTRYRLRWREGGRLKSKEISKEEWEGYRDRINRGQMLGHTRSLIRFLLAEVLGGQEALERQRAIERMIESGQPIAEILAAIMCADPGGQGSK